MAKIYYTAEEVADELRVSQRTLYRYIQSGRLTGQKADGARKWLFTRADIDAFMNGDTKGRHTFDPRKKQKDAHKNSTHK